MVISNECKLVVSNLYEYDFSSCFYNLLKNIGWDLSSINFEDKEERNISIGKLRKNNPELSTFLLNQTESLIDYYLMINKLTRKNVIVDQNDGIIIDKKMNNITSTTPIDFKGDILRLIISVDRNKFIKIKDTGETEVKGVLNKPLDISFYDMFKHISFANTKGIVKGLEYIRRSILNGTNIRWYISEQDDKIIVPIKDEGFISLGKSLITMIDIEEIDRKIIWNNYVWPFVQPILISCLS